MCRLPHPQHPTSRNPTITTVTGQSTRWDCERNNQPLFSLWLRRNSTGYIHSMNNRDIPSNVIEKSLKIRIHWLFLNVSIDFIRFLEFINPPWSSGVKITPHNPYTGSQAEPYVNFMKTDWKLLSFFDYFLKSKVIWSHNSDKFDQYSEWHELYPCRSLIGVDKSSIQLRVTRYSRWEWFNCKIEDLELFSST